MADNLKPKRRWFCPSPGWLVLCSLLLTGLLLVSERFRWFAFNQHKGWTVLIAVASVIAALVVMLLWWLAALLFHWRFQFSVRSLLLSALAIALPCGWLAGDMKKAREQRKVVQEIEKIAGPFEVGTGLGDSFSFGPIQYDWQRANRQTPGAPWLRNLLGEDFFSEIVRVFTLNMKNADTKLECLHALTALEHLTLEGADVTDAGLDHLKHLSCLRTLGLRGTQVTDAGVKNLQQALPNCKIERR